MKEKNQQEKYIDNLLNNKLLAILTIGVAVIIGISELKKAFVDIMPNYREEYCKKQQNELVMISQKILEINSAQLKYSDILKIKIEVENLLKFQAERKNYSCVARESIGEINNSVADKLLVLTFAQVEEWKNANDSKEARERVEHTCLIAKKFLEATNTYSKKEMETINSTLILLSK